MRVTSYFTRSRSGKVLIFVCSGLLLCSLLALSFWLGQVSSPRVLAKSSLHPFTITSPNFSDGGPLSVRNEFNQDGCSGGNIAPVLRWKNAPAGTQSFVLFLVDYDAPLAGGWHHWVVYNIPANVNSLRGDNPFTEGVNDFGTSGYGGPCPPATGETHHYLFLLYATDLPNVGSAGMTYAQVLSVIQNDVLGATSMIGTFHLPLDD